MSYYELPMSQVIRVYRHRVMELLIWCLLKISKARSVNLDMGNGNFDTFELRTEQSPEWYTRRLISTAHNGCYRVKSV